MRALVQRVKSASIKVDGIDIASIETGILLLLGIARNDGEKDIDYIVDKTLNLRIFPDEHGVMNKSLMNVSGELLLVSQFTLYGDTRKGRRPSYNFAAPAEQALPVFERVLQTCRSRYARVKSGLFQAQMDVSLVNDGPVTLMIDSEKPSVIAE